jgi:peroxiredoxin
MAVLSTMLELGTPLPPFSLPDVTTGARVASSDLLGSVAVVAFLCNHCPYVVHLQEGLVRFGEHARDRGAKMVAISPNDVAAYPEDGPAEMAALARRVGFPFPYLYDEDQGVAKAFRAACTPEFYVFDRDGKLAYRGRFDASTPKNAEPVTGAEALAALDALLLGGLPGPDQKPSMGCNIKWKPGNAPDYQGG